MQETLKNTLYLYAYNEDNEIRKVITVNDDYDLWHAVGYIQSLVDLEYFIMNEFEEIFHLGVKYKYCLKHR